MSLTPLPIDAVLPELVSLVRSNPAVVVRAPTGSGKTTRIPPALLDGAMGGSGQLVMLEPRRIAARAAAQRIAFERGCQIGDEVGYVVRFDQMVGPATRIKLVTDGVLLRMLQENSFLEGIHIVIFDEFHERGLNADLALAMVRRVQQTVRPDLRIVVMSATLAEQSLADFFDSCPVVEAHGRLFPIEISYRPADDPRPLEIRIAGAVESVIDRTPGDLLVFLPGLAEIRRAAKQLGSLAVARDLAVMELYGDLPMEQQDSVLAPITRRKVVLATNVAETSLTISGITAVIDSGLARVLRYEPSVGLDRLVLSKISRAAADQRAGRAGRAQPGICVRLWTERDHDARPGAEQPEVQRVDLASALLELHAWGETDPRQFPWFEPPSEESVQQAEAVLSRLGAISNHRITELGQKMVQIPAHPRLARLLIEGRRCGVADQAALTCALLSERDPFQIERAPAGQSRLSATTRRSSSDVVDRVLALEDFERTGRLNSAVGQLKPAAARHVLRVRDQLRKLVRGQRQSAVTDLHAIDDGLRQSIFVAFSDRLARRREPKSRGAVVAGGRGVRLSNSSSVVDAPLFVCVEVSADKSESLVHLASAVERAWLSADGFTTEEQLHFDEASERVVAVRRTSWQGLVLEEVPLNVPSDQRVASVLSAAAIGSLGLVVPRDDIEYTNLIARIGCLREWMPELDLPMIDDAQIRRWLPEISLGMRSFAELRRAPWVDLIKGKLTFGQLQSLDRHAPERLAVPSGSRIALKYELNRPPVLAVRIQELFGLPETPRIAGGRVAVLLHLLGPNMRPQQVTDDLQSFWNTTYPKIRSELRRRYPKHSWPEDPMTAEPRSRPGRNQ